MPGLYGMIGSNDKSSFTKMCNILAHQSYKSDSFASGQFMLGRLHLGTFFPSSQPFWDESQKYGIIVDGYVVINENISDSQAEERRTLRTLIELYKKEGDGFLNHIDTGMFNLLIIDLEHSKIKIMNDRLGRLPLYYGLTTNDSFCFAPEEKALVQTGIIEKRIDWVGLAEFLHFSYLIGDRTFYQGVKLLGPATLLEYNLETRKLSCKTYFEYHHSRTENYETDRWADLLFAKVKNSCRRTNLPGNTYALMHSGGLDSRLILGSWNNTGNTVAYTYGMGQCPDIKISKKVAKKAGIRQYIFTYDADTFLNSYRESMWTMEQLGHPNIPSFAKYIKSGDNGIVVAGFMGDVTLGGIYLSTSPLLHLPESELTPYIYRRITGRTTPRLAALLSEDVWQKVKDQEQRIHEDIAAIVSRYANKSCSRDEAFEMFQILNQERRRYHLQQVRIRHYLEFVEPLCDYDYLDTIFSIPLELRIERQLQFKIYRRHLHRLGSIRRTNSFIPPTWPYYFQRWDQRAYKRPKWRERNPNVGPPMDLSRWFRESKKLSQLTRDILLGRPDLVNTDNARVLLDNCENRQASIDLLVTALVSFVLWWEMFWEAESP